MVCLNQFLNAVSLIENKTCNYKNNLQAQINPLQFGMRYQTCSLIDTAPVQIDIDSSNFIKEAFGNQNIDDFV